MRLKYVLSEVLVGLWRNVTMTIAMIITMTVSLTLLGSSVVLYWQVNDMRNVYYQQIEVSLFLKVTDTTQAQKDAIEADLNADMQPGGLVDHWQFETKQQAYDNFKVIFQAVPEPIRVRDPWQVERRSRRVSRRCTRSPGSAVDRHRGVRRPGRGARALRVLARRGATGRGRDGRLGHGATDRGWARLVATALQSRESAPLIHS